MKQKAVLISGLKHPLIIGDHEVPRIGDNEILIENKAIGLNPIDWKSKKYNFSIYSFPWINGRESSGVVVEMGSEVKDLKAGDRVILASTSYRDIRTSTFQNYTVIDYRLVWKLPEFLSFEQGASIGVGLITAAIIFYDSFKIKYDEVFHNDEKIMIYGGSTIVGLYLTQLARIHGLQVVSVSSVKYSAYLKRQGADHVLCRMQQPSEIIESASTLGNVVFGVDCISSETSLVVLNTLANFPNSKFAGVVKVPKDSDVPVEICPVVIKNFHEKISLGQELINVTSEYLHTQKVTPVNIKKFDGFVSIIPALQQLEEEGANCEKYIVSVT